MKVFGIVGSIGAGKSTVREIFAKMIEGAYSPVIEVCHVDLDVAIKEIYHNNPFMMGELVLEFGPIMAKDKLDAERFGYVIENIFANDMKYKRLMGLLSHYLDIYIKGLIASCQEDAVDILIIEGVHFIHSEKLAAHLDVVLHVRADYNTCISRVSERGKYTSEQIQILYNRTVPSSEFRSKVPNVKIYYVNTDDNTVHQRLLNILTDEISSNLLESPKVSIYDTHEDHHVPTTIRTAIYAGSFNPLHKGHMDVVDQLLKMFDQVVILKCINGYKGMGVNRDLPERHERYPIDVSKLPERCVVEVWGKAFVDYLDYIEDTNLDVVIARGIRNGSDLEYENSYIRHITDQYKMRGKELPPVIYIPCSSEYRHISSSSIKAIQPFEPEYANTLLADCIVTCG